MGRRATGPGHCYDSDDMHSFPASLDAPVPSPAGRSFPPGCGLLVVGHGTADTVGAAETARVAELVAVALPGVPVALGFLEVIGPTIGDGLAQLADRGCREVVAAPLLLFAAGHAKRDVPDAIAGAAATLGIAVRLAGPFGCHPAIVRLARERRLAAVPDDVPPERTALVMVGRGSSDPSAPGQLDAFATATLASGSRPARRLLGFVAAARPTVAEALAEAADPTWPEVRRIVVQPHLLFRGHVEEQVTAAVASARASRPDLEWVQVPRLGPDPAIAEALIDRASEAIGVSLGSVRNPAP